MASVNSATNSGPMLLVILLIAVVAIGGYYMYQEQKDDTVLDVNIGGKQITAEIDR